MRGVHKRIEIYPEHRVFFRCQKGEKVNDFRHTLTLKSAWLWANERNWYKSNTKMEYLHLHYFDWVILLCLRCLNGVWAVLLLLCAQDLPYQITEKWTRESSGVIKCLCKHKAKYKMPNSKVFYHFRCASIESLCM